MGAVRFAGYAAVFHHADRGGDVLLPGALVARGRVPLLWQHRGQPVGAVEWIGEDARGVRIVARIAADEPARLVKAGAITGLSFGYRALRVRQGVRRVIARAELVEISLVAQPMQPLARIHAVEDG
ncbi:HK97 family phage prohead protease [Sphingomonas sp. Leaf4]|uniref:HK97 family phage prohead protease n=1 Tax=Sphingomonas sp. Leaf4 TaxID=2876553 RepID=UPI001E5D7855|nr:HK97 family phage prohead protease [Sphingomonas sp. Leaf4]